MVKFLLSVAFSILLYNVLLVFKVNNAYKNQTKILDAIESYADETKDKNKALCLLNNMEEFEETIWRLTDWGYKNILPKEDFELIEPYIK